MVERKKRILTGIRPTGPLHLGHYGGALENWVKLQDDYDCYFLIADYQVSDYVDDMARVREAVWEVALDWLAVGLDPERSSFFIESLIPEHAELTLWLSWLLPLGMLQRNPTLKAEMEDFGRKSVPVAFFNYPVMQVANILLLRAHVSRARWFGGSGAAAGGGRRPGQDEQVAEQRYISKGHSSRRERESPLTFPPRWILHPKPAGLDGEEIETVHKLKGLPLRRAHG